MSNKDPNSMYVYIRNFGIVRKGQLKLEPGLTILRGSSGSGKSTIMRAIEDTIYNTPGDSTVTNGETVQAVKIEYQGHTIIRRKDLNSRSDKTVYQVDGVVYGKLGRQPLPQVLSLMNMEEMKLLDSKVRLNLVSQFSPPFLIRESPPKVFEVLSSSTDIDLPSILRQMRSDLDELTIQKRTLEAVHNSTSKAITRDKQTLSTLSTLPNVLSKISSLKPLSDSLTSLQSLLSNLHLHLSKGRYLTKLLSNSEPLLKEPPVITYLLSNLQSLDKLLPTLYYLSKEIESTESQLLLLEQELSINLPDINLIQSNDSQLQSLNLLLSNLSQLELEILSIESTLSIQIPSLSPIDSYLTLTTLLQSLSELERAISDDNQNLDQLTLSLEQTNQELSSFKVCPLCNQPLPHNHGGPV